MKDWLQPICPACFRALELGRAMEREPELGRFNRSTLRVGGGEDELCLLCGEPNNGVQVRIDPRLTAGLRSAREKEEEEPA